MAVASAVVSSPALGAFVDLGTLEAANFGVHTFVAPPGSFSDILNFTLGGGVTGATASAVSLDLSNILGLSSFVGTLFNGYNAIAGQEVGGAPLLSDSNFS